MDDMQSLWRKITVQIDIPTFKSISGMMLNFLVLFEWLHVAQVLIRLLVLVQKRISNFVF